MRFRQMLNKETYNNEKDIQELNSLFSVFVYIII